jgi:hypothetical protein
MTWLKRDIHVKPVKTGFDASLQEARLAEAAHLDALMRAQDAGALRLDLLRGLLLDRLAPDSPLRASMALRLPPDFPSRLFLDLTRSVCLGTDGRSFVLEQDHDTHRSALATTDSAEEMAAHILRLEAHGVIASARRSVEERLKPMGLRTHNLTTIQLVALWTSGFLAGGVLLVIVTILLK